MTSAAGSAAGPAGAFAAAHPAAVEAGREAMAAGGNAVDAAIAAQAVLAVALPDACGVGGDGLVLVREPDGRVTAVNGVGRSAATGSHAATTGGASVTVPGLVGAWQELSDRWGRLGLAAVLAPAARLARDGVPITATQAEGVEAQRRRLVAGGAAAWPLLGLAPGDAHVQPDLATVLDHIGMHGAAGFYAGPYADGIVEAVARTGGRLTHEDLRRHRTQVGPPLSVPWQGGTVHVQPPSSQGVLLAMALAWLERADVPAPHDTDHIAVELTEAAFVHRDDAADGMELLGRELEVDPERAARRAGPRSYLHTAGVATADADGLVVSSLVSVFDDFGSAVFVPTGGFVLNNRAGGFTGGRNAFAPGALPVHTLAPAFFEGPRGPVALATPGADGQVQTLLQVLVRCALGADWTAAVTAPRWRSEDGALLIETGHPAAAALTRTGHELRERAPGDPVFGAVVCAGLDIGGQPFAVGDFRRDVAVGAW